MQRRTIETKVYKTFFLLYLKRNDGQNFKCSSWKTFSSVCHWYNFLQWIVLILWHNWKTLLFKRLSIPWVSFFNHHLWKNVLKEVRVSHYLQNNSANDDYRHAMKFVKTGPSEGIQILWVQQEKRALMRSEHTLGFFLSVLDRDGYFKYCKWVKNPSKSS